MPSTLNQVNLPKFYTVGMVIGWQLALLGPKKQRNLKALPQHTLLCEEKKQLAALLAMKHIIITLKHNTTSEWSTWMFWTRNLWLLLPSLLCTVNILATSYVFNQDSMRWHHIICLVLSKFLIKRTRWKWTASRSEDNIKIHCSCLMPKVVEVD